MITYLLFSLVFTAFVGSLGETDNFLYILLLGILWPLTAVWFIFLWWGQRR